MLEILDLKNRLKQVPDPRAFIAYPMAFTPLLRFYAELILAKDPFIERPPPVSMLAPPNPNDPRTTASTNITSAVAERLAEIVHQPIYWSHATIEKAFPTPAGGVPSIYARDIATTPYSLLIAARMTSMQRTLPRMRRRLSADPRYTLIIDAIRACTEEPWQLGELAIGLGPGGLADTDHSATARLLAVLSMYGNAQRLLDASIFTKSSSTEGEDREDTFVRNQAMVATRLATFVEWCATRWFDFVLRTQLQYLLMPLNQARLAQVVNPAVLGPFLERAARIMSRPTHHWLADIMKYFAPATRMTHLGATATCGLFEHHLEYTWGTITVNDAFPHPTHAMADMTSVRHLFDALVGCVTDWADRLRLLEEIGGLAEIETAVKAVKPAGANNVYLWGPSQPVIHVGPISGSALPGMNGDLFTGFVLPTALAPAAGGAGLPYRYTAADERSTLVVGGVRSLPANMMGNVVISVQPEEPERFISHHLAGLLPPSHLQYAAVPFYNGEVDALLIERSIEGIAQVYGQEPSAMTAIIQSDPVPWAHLLTVDATGAINFTKPNMLVYSTMTRREPTQRLVSVPSLAPKHGVVVKEGQGVIVAPVVQRFMLDMMPVRCDVDLSTTVASLEKLALSVIKDGVLNGIRGEVQAWSIGHLPKGDSTWDPLARRPSQRRACERRWEGRSHTAGTQRPRRLAAGCDGTASRHVLDAQLVTS